MSRVLVVFAILLGLAAPPAAAAIAPLAEAAAERVLGRPEAPVTIVEHSSLGCPHCASFHRETLPKIKEKYIDTGKVKLVFADFPLGGLALAASMVSRCAPKDGFFGMIELFFREQERWSRAREPMKEIERIARFGGLSEKDVKACLDTQPLLAAIRERAERATREMKVESTPTFFVDGQRIEGAQPYAEFEKAIEAALRKKAK